MERFLETCRLVTFDCGHTAHRLCRRGASLVGRDEIFCAKCEGPRRVVSEGPIEAAPAVGNEA